MGLEQHLTSKSTQELRDLLVAISNVQRVLEEQPTDALVAESDSTTKPITLEALAKLVRGLQTNRVEINMTITAELVAADSEDNVEEELVDIPGERLKFRVRSSAFQVNRSSLTPSIPHDTVLRLLEKGVEKLNDLTML